MVIVWLMKILKAKKTFYPGSNFVIFILCNNNENFENKKNTLTANIWSRCSKDQKADVIM